MKIAADFGITVTDLLRKDKDGNLFHNMQLSSGEVSPEYLKQLFKDLDLNKEVELIAVTGGRHLSIGEEVEGVSVIHVNEIDAIGEGAMHLSGVDPAKPTIIISAGSGTACIFAKDNKFSRPDCCKNSYLSGYGVSSRRYSSSWKIAFIYRSKKIS